MIEAELYRVKKLWKLSGEQIVAQHAEETHRIFEQAAKAGHVLPVILRVRDEQEDLPATILALSRSHRPVVPIVVSNGSVDNTVEIARQMAGTDNVIDIKEPGLMGATQAGIKLAHEQYGAQVMLVTDGDTLMPAHWAGNMEKKLGQIDSGKGVFLNAGVIYARGNSRIADAAVNAHDVWHIVKRKIRHRIPGPMGSNRGIVLDNGGRMMEALTSLDPTIFFFEDFAMRDVLIKTGATISVPLSLGIVGISRGDQNRLGDLFGRRKNKIARLMQTKQQKYANTLGGYKAFLK